MSETGIDVKAFLKHLLGERRNYPNYKQDQIRDCIKEVDSMDTTITSLRAEIAGLRAENIELREEISALHQEQDTQESLEKFAKAMSDIMSLHKLRSRAESAEEKVEKVREAVESNYERPATLRGVIKNIIGEVKP